MDIENLYNLFKTLLPYANQVLEPQNPFLKNVDEIQKMIKLIDDMGGINNLIRTFNLKNEQKIDSQIVKKSCEIEKYPKIIDLE